MNALARGRLARLMALDIRLLNFAAEQKKVRAAKRALFQTAQQENLAKLQAAERARGLELKRKWRMLDQRRRQHARLRAMAAERISRGRDELARQKVRFLPFWGGQRTCLPVQRAAGVVSFALDLRR